MENLQESIEEVMDLKEFRSKIRKKFYSKFPDINAEISNKLISETKIFILGVYYATKEMSEAPIITNDIKELLYSSAVDYILSKINKK